MANTSVIKRIFSISPHIEMICRKIYWANIKTFSKKGKKRGGQKKPSYPISFVEIERFLRKSGVSNGCLMVVHSAYGPFKGGGKTPEQLLEMLIEIIGKEGTIAMPATPKFKNFVSIENYLDKRNDDAVYEYDVQKSPIKTGVLPLILHKKNNSIRSRHPINSLVSLGPLAEILMENNLVGPSSLACGVDSSWKHCVDHDAVIVGFGTDLTHSLTMIHVAEDVLDEKWPINDWYIEKNFLIVDGEYREKIKLRERAPHWGALHYGERTLCKDLIDAGLLKTTIIDGVTIEVLKARSLIDFLNKKNCNGYPYFWVKKWIH